MENELLGVECAKKKAKLFYGNDMREADTFYFPFVFSSFVSFFEEESVAP